VIVPIPSPEKTPPPDPAEVGSKAASLIRMAAAGLPVPPGKVLPVSFFEPWLGAIRASDAWVRLTQAPPERWGALCEEVKGLVARFSWSDPQRDELDALRRDLAASHPGSTFAVRSSSPEEDLAAASFAGGYETRLGVPLEGLEPAIRACFTSCLDARILAYKREHGLELWSPRIAVIVQRQIDSAIAGVAFSIDPATNDYDEAAIDASWGLGNTVVEGRVSPDHFVVDKRSGVPVEQTLGDKQISTWLQAEGGTVERAHRRKDRTLNDARLREVTSALCRVEELYGVPVDVEWAYEGESLHLLQARPITSWVPLPPEMLTDPGARRLLYGDGALSKGLTINEPISPLGLDAMEVLFTSVLESRLGPLPGGLDPRRSPFFFAGGRMYANLSQLLWLSSPKSMARQNKATDALMAAILSGIDRKRYRSARRPAWLGFSLLWQVPRTLWNLRRFFWNALRIVAFPEPTRRALQETVDGIERQLHEDEGADVPLDEAHRGRADHLARDLFDVLMPMLLVGLVPAESFAPRKGDSRLLAAKLGLGVPGNVVVEMGIALFRLARSLAPSDFEDLPLLAKRIERREMPAGFLSAWDAFLGRFGWRGPLEMDLASPRYADDPLLALRQMSFMATGPQGTDPEAIQRRQAADRQGAFEELMRRSGVVRRPLLRRVHRIVDLYASTRDTPKHLSVLLNYRIRRRALAEGRRLVEAGRLDSPEHVFDLRFADLRAAREDASLDLRRVREERTRFLRQLAAAVRWFPPVIDSRGRILRPPSPEDSPGLLRGMAVSAGVARGPVKVLRTPYEKVVEPGDVLVAYTTDPGWTPLFVNAAAIILEVGGVLQHGAVVAREYGKPCVVGIDRVVRKLEEGQVAEVDGTSGTVRLLG